MNACRSRRHPLFVYIAVVAAASAPASLIKKIND